MNRFGIALVALILAFTAACMSGEYELVRVTATWVPEDQVIRYHAVLRNVGPGLFGCEAVEPCVEILAAPDVFDLGDSGAVEMSHHLVRRGEELDYVMEMSAPQDSDFATGMGIVVELEGKAGKQKPHLVVLHEEMGSPVELPGGTRVRTQTTSEDGETKVQTIWSLPKKTRTVVLEERTDEEYTPILAALPGLAEALEKAGLLAP